MVASLTYRTDDGTRWGGGQGSDLAAVTIDLNFWSLFSAIEAVEAAQTNGAGIDYITQPVNGNIFFVHLTDHRVLGPFTLPAAQWNPRGEWQPATLYAPFDVVSHNGSLYIVTVQHTSAGTFSPFATDGLGHSLYILILSSPANSLPDGGTLGQRLTKASGSPYITEWTSDKVRPFVFCQGQPQPNELLLQFTVVDHMTLPVGLSGTVAFANTPTQTDVSFTISLNGASIGSIDFSGPSPEEVSVTFPSTIACEPGDVLTVNGPAVPDTIQADISITLVALLTE